MKTKNTDLLQGTLDLLLLKVLKNRKMHGWGISQKIRLLSEEVFQVKEGSLYPALHRLERKHWIRAEWGLSENNRKAKFYAITSTGLKQLDAEEAQWKHFVDTMSLILTYSES